MNGAELDSINRRFDTLTQTVTDFKVAVAQQTVPREEIDRDNALMHGRIDRNRDRIGALSIRVYGIFVAGGTMLTVINVAIALGWIGSKSVIP